MTPTVVACVHVLVGFGLGSATTLAALVLLWFRRNRVQYRVVEGVNPRQYHGADSGRFATYRRHTLTEENVRLLIQSEQGG